MVRARDVSSVTQHLGLRSWAVTTAGPETLPLPQLLRPLPQPEGARAGLPLSLQPNSPPEDPRWLSDPGGNRNAIVCASGRHIQPLFLLRVTLVRMSGCSCTSLCRPQKSPYCAGTAPASLFHRDLGIHRPHSRKAISEDYLFIDVLTKMPHNKFFLLSALFSYFYQDTGTKSLRRGQGHLCKSAERGLSQPS